MVLQNFRSTECLCTATIVSVHRCVGLKLLYSLSVSKP